MIFIFILDFIFVYSFAVSYCIGHYFFVVDYSIIHSMGIMLPASLAVTSLLALSGKYKKYLSYILIVVASVVNAICIGHAYLFRSEIESGSIYAILKTNKYEASGFISSFFSFELLVLVLFCLAIPIIIYYLKNKKITVAYFLTFKVFTVVISLLVLLYPISNDTIAIKNIDYNLRRLPYISIFNNIYAASKANKLTTSIPENIQSQYNGSQIVILIICESMNRNHLSLYGYPRKTTPMLEQENILTYTDVLSPSSVTWRSIPHLLTFSNLQNKEQICTIFNLFHEAGFETYWISGDKNKKDDDTIFLISQSSENIYRSVFIDPNDHDDLLFEEAVKAVNSEALKKLIIIQTWGNHTTYKANYPQDFTEFTGDAPKAYPGADNQTINEYDTAIKYKDKQLAEFIENIENREDIILLVTADHGEEVGDLSTTFGHSSSSTFTSCFEVPFLLYISNEYKTNLDDLVFDISRPYQTDNLIHSIMDLAKIQSPLFQPKLSLFNSKFQEQKRYIQDKEYGTK